MFIRFVHAHVNPDKLQKFRQTYSDVILRTLKSTAGCVSATLIQSTTSQDEYVSMTIWESQADAERYESSGVFRKLLESIEPYLAQSSEWKIQLSKELQLEYLPMKEDPVVKSYEVAVLDGESDLPSGETLFVRIVSPHVRRESADEFRRLYTEEILPALRVAPGCRYAYLVENDAEDDRFLSVTIWNSAQDAEAYEHSGTFDNLTAKVQHTFSDIFQWKMQLERDVSNQVVTTEDLKVKGFSVVLGSRFS